VMVVRRNHLII